MLKYILLLLFPLFISAQQADGGNTISSTRDNIISFSGGGGEVWLDNCAPSRQQFDPVLAEVCEERDHVEEKYYTIHRGHTRVVVDEENASYLVTQETKVHQFYCMRCHYRWDVDEVNEKERVLVWGEEPDKPVAPLTTINPNVVGTLPESK